MPKIPIFSRNRLSDTPLLILIWYEAIFNEANNYGNPIFFFWDSISYLIGVFAKTERVAISVCCNSLHFALVFVTIPGSLPMWKSLVATNAPYNAN